MDFSAFGDFGTMAAGLLLAGVAGGLIAGLLGAGGGVIIVPMIYSALSGSGIDESLRMHIAVGTSLATIIPTSLSSVQAHAQRGAVDWGIVKVWGPAMVAGVILGSFLSSLVNGHTLSIIFVCFAIPMAYLIAFKRDDAHLPERIRSGWIARLIAGAIGTIATMMGSGGGGMGGMILTASGMPVHRAVGTGSAFGMMVSVPGAIGAIIGGLYASGLPPYSIGYVSLIGFVLIAPAAFLCAPLGASLAHMTDQKRLRYLFAGFVFISAGRMLYDVIA